MTAPKPTTLPFDDLEAAYEALATAIDAAGTDKEAVFLARLALTLAHETGDLALFRRAIATALDAGDDDKKDEAV